MLKVIEKKSKGKAKPFPKLMISKDGYIFYFVREWYGLPLTGDNDFWSFGDDDFADFSERTDYGFTDYNEPITIQNA